MGQAPLDKRQIVALFCAKLAAEADAMARAARGAREAATHEEARPENDKDTRGLEASYLARGQSARFREIERARNALEFMHLRAFQPGEAAALSALVELDDAPHLYFLVPVAGGLTASVDGVEVLGITPDAPVGRALIGVREGDSVELRARSRVVEHTVLSVR